MGYATEHLRKCADLGGIVGGNIFTYDTADAVGTVDTSGYITDAVEKGMQKGDILILRVWSAVPDSNDDVVTAAGSAPTLTSVNLMYVKGITAAGAADLTDVLALTATNTD